MGKHTSFGVLLLNGLLVFLVLGFRHQALIHLVEVNQGLSSSLPYATMSIELMVFTTIIGLLVNGILIASYAFKK